VAPFIEKDRGVRSLRGTPKAQPGQGGLVAVFDGSEVQEGMLAIRVARDDGGCVICLEGEMDLSNSPVAEATLREEVAKGPPRIVVDMRELSFIDSTGIALLVRFLNEDDGADRLRFLPSRFQEVTRVLRLTGVEEKLTPADSLPS
jgi:anti-anti-sigma factor